MAHKLRLALTALAIVLGVTFISGTLVLTDTLHNTFTTLFGNIYKNVDFEVRGKAAFSNNPSNGGGAVRKPIPESILPTVRQVPGVAYAEGTLSGFAQFIAPDGKAVTTGGRTDHRHLLRPQPAAVGAQSDHRRGPDQRQRSGHGRRHRPEVPLPRGRPRADPPDRSDPDLHHLGDRQIRHRRQPGRRHAGRLRRAHGPEAVQSRSGTSTPSTSWPSPASTRPRSNGPSPVSSRTGWRWSPARPWPTSRPTRSTRPCPSSRRRCWSSPSSRCSWAGSPSSTRSRSWSASAPASWRCCGSWGPVDARCSAPCSSRPASWVWWPRWSGSGSASWPRSASWRCSRASASPCPPGPSSSRRAR